MCDLAVRPMACLFDVSYLFGDAVGYVVIACRCLLAVVFFVSAVSKTRNREAFGEFVRSARTLGRLPAGWARPVAVVVVGVEAAIPPLLVWPPTVGAGFVLAVGLLVPLTGTIVVALRRGVRAPCRCFGASPAALGVHHVARNGLLGGVAATGAVTDLAAGSFVLQPGGVAVALFVGAVAAAVIVVLDDLVDLFRAPPWVSASPRARG